MSDVKVNGWVLVPRIDAELTPEERARVEELLRMISEVERGERK